MKNTLVILLAAVIVSSAILAIYMANPSKPLQEPPQQLHTDTTEEISSGYKYVTQKSVGHLKSNQEADVILYATGFDDSGGYSVLNHPGKVATDGKRLIVSDTWNNRILIWNEIPTKSNQQPDMVLGQPNFNSNAAGLSATNMNWPMGIATDGKRLIVGDANNDRVLVWNEFPTRNGQPADLVLGAPDFNTWPNNVNGGCERDPTTRIYWPWDIWTDGEKLIIGSTGGGGTLIWKSFPTGNNQPADIVLGAENFSTRFSDISNYNPDPLVVFSSSRSVASDGKSLVLGTYHPHMAYFYSEFPTKSGERASFSMPFTEWGVMGLDLKNGKLFASIGQHVYIWDSFPQNSDSKPNAAIGVTETKEKVLLSPDKKIFYQNEFNFPYDVASDGKRMIVADTSNNRILIFNEIPASFDKNADVVLGKPEIFQSRKSFSSGPLPFSDGTRLIVGVDGIGVWIYNNLPDESNAPADVVIGKIANKTIVGGHAITDGKKLIMSHREGSKILIWNEIPKKDNQLPDVILGSSTQLDDWGSGDKGRTGMNNPVGLATDGTRLFVVDQENNRILIWNSIPATNQTPADIVLGQLDFESSSIGNNLNQFDRPTQISTDDSRLAVVDQNNNRVLVWKTLPTTNGQPADFEIKIVNHSAQIDCTGIPQYARLSLPSGVFIYNNTLSVTDNGNNRVLFWSKFPESESDEPDVVLGQKDFMSNYPSNTKNGFLLPAAVSFDGSYLWVGETKWADRLLRFSVQPA